MSFALNRFMSVGTNYSYLPLPVRSRALAAAGRAAQHRSAERSRAAELLGALMTAKEIACFPVRNTPQTTSFAWRGGGDGSSSSRCVVIASATAVVAMFLPNRYRASTSIIIVPQRVPENFVQSTVTAELSRAPAT